MPSDAAADAATDGDVTALPSDGDAALATLFDLLSDETRLRIVSALAAHEHHHPDDAALGFAALRERVDARDSGRFNYHLSKLAGVLVEKTDDGYRLTATGRHVVRIVSEVPQDPLPA